MSARMRTHLLLPLLGILMAWPEHPRLEFWIDGIAMTPMRLTLLAAAMVYFYGLWLHRHVNFGIAGVMCLGMTGFGHSPEAMRYNTVSVLDRIMEFIRTLFPRTLMQWGIVSVAASFVLLGLGVLMSLFRLPTRSAGEARVEPRLQEEHLHVN
jgi:hypothetical protein